MSPQIPKPDPSGSESDQLAKQEDKNWDQYEDLNRAKHNNKMLVHKTIGWLIPVALVVAFLGFLALSGVYVLHLVIGKSRGWLSADELQNIHSIIFSSVVGGAIALIVKSYFADELKAKGD